MGKIITAKRRGYKDPSTAAAHSFYNLYRSIARHKRHSFKIGREKFKSLIGKSCHYCGVKPSNLINPYLRKDGSMKSNSHTITLTRARISGRFVNGLDRKDNNKGYTSGNLVPCCLQCNGAKSDYSLKEFQKWIRRIIKFKTKNSR